MNTARVRKATLEDLSQLATLFDKYRIFYRKASDLEGATRFLSERITRKESEIFVAEAEGKIVGFTQLYPQFSSTRIKRSWLLNDLYVLESWRAKGIAKLLLEAAKQLARDTNAAGLLLETEKTNMIGNRLYPAAGFSIYDQTNFYWWDNNA